MAHAEDINSSSLLFIDTNLDTHFATIVSRSDTISDLKRKIILEHHQCFPAIGDIKIECLKVKRGAKFYHLPDSLLVMSAFATVKGDWFLSIDVSRLAQSVGIQQVDNYRVGDQQALHYATDNREVDKGSPSTHLTIVPILDHVVSSVNQLTTGDSDKDYLKNTEKNRSFDNEINLKKRTLVQTESLLEDASRSGTSVEKKRKTEEKEASVKADGENIIPNNENSMENNIRDSNDESTRLDKGEECSGMDQEATIVSSSIENVGEEAHIVLPHVSKVLEKNIEQEIPPEISQKEKGVSQLVQNASETVPAILMAVEESIRQEMPSEISQKEKGESPLVENNSEDSETVPAALMAVEENIQQEIQSEISQKEKGESPLVENNSESVENNSESSETPAVLMAVEENIQQELPSEISQKENENELVKERVTGDEILSSLMRASDCELDDSEKDKTAEKEVLSTSLRETIHALLKDAADMSEKDLGSTVQESAGDQTDDNLREDKELSKKQEPGVKLHRRKKKAKKSAARNKDESAKNKDEAPIERADNTVSEISSVVPAIAHETKNDKVSLSNAERHEVLEKTVPDDVTMQEVEISKPSEVVEETSKKIKDAVGRRKKKKDVGKSATRNDALTMTNEENVVPHSGTEESQDITLIDALLVGDWSTDDILANNDAEVPRTEKNVSRGNDESIDGKPDNENEKMDDEKRKKRKKKTKRSAKNGEGGMSTEISHQHLNDHLNENAKEHKTTLFDAAGKEGDEVKGRDTQVSDVGLVTKAKKNKKSSVTGPEDLPSKCQSTELELEPENSQSTDHQTSKNMTVSEVVTSKDSVNGEGNMPKEGSRDIEFLDYFTPGKDSTTYVKLKKRKKKTKEQLLVDSKNESAIQPQKLNSESENKKVPTNVVNDPNIPNPDQFKTPPKKSKVHAPRISKSAQANKADGEPSTKVFLNQKSDRPRVILGLARVKTVLKSAPEVNKSQHVNSLLSGSGTIFGGDSGESSADVNASPGRSSSGDIASSIDLRTDGSSALKRKGDGGNSQSKSKNTSLTDRLRNSSRFKRAKLTALQQLGDTESEPVEFVPESPPMSKG